MLRFGTVLNNIRIRKKGGQIWRIYRKSDLVRRNILRNRRRISENVSTKAMRKDCTLSSEGKLVHDKHAMRVLPGFDENAKIKLLQRMSDQAEIIICIYAGDITTSKTRQDFGITYDLEVMRLIDIFRKHNLKINSVVVTRYEDTPSVNMFMNKLERRGIRVYKHRFTKGYPTDVDVIVSDEATAPIRI